MKILFVATRKNCDPNEREFYEMDFTDELLGFKRSLFDLGLLTVAACTPKDVEIEIFDEYLKPLTFETDADLIALSAKTSAVARAYEVAAEFRKRGKKVVLGGIHASLRPEEALEHVDHVVVGEAEHSWPAFVEAFRRGEAPRKSGDMGYFPPMDQIPIPAWDRIPYGDFLLHQIQSTRGCPFTCRFCSVPDISGNTFRFKPVEHIVKEIRSFPSSGLIKNKIKNLYFVDDNFLSRPKYTKQLLEALIPLWEKGELREWSAETTLNVAADDELLDLFAAAGCATLIIGFESVSEATLLDMDKKVNFVLSYQEALERIHSRGISVMGNFIVGFDTDTLAVFREILEFVDANNILFPFFSILTPMPGTKLHEDFKAANRLDHFDWGQYDTRHVVFEPRHMTREQLMDGYCFLYDEAYRSRRALDRLERYWQKYRKRRSTFLENFFVGLKVGRMARRESPEFRRFVDEAWTSLKKPGQNSDIGQLIFYLDSAHFVEFLRGYRSPRYEENVRIFRGDQAAEAVDPALERKQWERSRRTKKAVGQSA